MDANARRQRDDIVYTLESICFDLNEVANGIVNQKGIGAEYCANRLASISRRYGSIKNTLSKLK